MKIIASTIVSYNKDLSLVSKTQIKSLSRQKRCVRDYPKNKNIDWNNGID